MSAKDLTPMMRQYFELKEQNPDCLLFFRLGDFYELFFDDALLASKELEIVLTGRSCGLEERAPMCGVPFHSVDGYINKLISKGYKVAICEQLTDPKDSIGLVDRGIIRIITPGTIIEPSMLDEQKNNYIMSLCLFDGIMGYATADVSTGEFTLCQLSGECAQIFDELSRIQPAEVIINKQLSQEGIYDKLKSSYYTSIYSDWAYDKQTAEKNLLSHFAVANLDGYGCADMPAGIRAAGSLLSYLNETQKNSLSHINSIHVHHRESCMMLDEVTRKNLELTQTMRGDKSKKGTLFGLLDHTQTAMGARLLRAWIEAPLYNKANIERRLDSVAELKDELILRDDVRDRLNQVYDIERICSRLAYGTINARDALSLKRSLAVLPGLKQVLSQCTSAELLEIVERMDTLEDVYELLHNAITPEPPIGVKDGNIIKEGYNAEVDRLHAAAENGKQWLTDLEKREREATGIKNLRIGYNKVFGYYIEVTRSYLAQVPFRYTRKQTLAGAERFITEELKSLETDLLGAQEKLIVIEYQIFCEIRTLLSDSMERLQLVAQLISKLDVYQALACAAERNRYCRPTVHKGTQIEITGGRHPVVELTQPAFVANDTLIDNDKNRLLIITGPNMAGKSTYMRQIALITLMAHIGSFVPAKSANIALVDRIFTRVGASDDLSSGRSTFMVEMSETANILNNATNKSLVLLDEIGRGTSTLDGLSIAWAVSEYMANPQKCGAKTLFATHYHELSELEGILDGAVNYRITAKEIGEDIIFLRKIVRGGTDKSFGIQVARLAGIPQDVIVRAREILERLEIADVNKSAVSTLQQQPIAAQDKEVQLVKDISKLEVDSITPFEALALLYELQQKAQSIATQNGK